MADLSKLHAQLSPKKKRQQAYRQGIAAEYWCMLSLLLKGYKILHRRYQTPVGEIDIIAAKRKQLIFVEVKQRGNEHAALEAVTPKTQQRIARAAQHYLQRHPKRAHWPMRFDVMVRVKRRWPKHYTQAFDAAI